MKLHELRRESVVEMLLYCTIVLSAPVRGRTAWLDRHATSSLPGQHALASEDVSNKATEFCQS